MKSIMYHYVQPNNIDFPLLNNLTFDKFVKQLDFFKEKYSFVTKEDFIKSIKTKIPTKGIILTFDDGLKCHYDFVYKELRKRKLWGIFYINTMPYIENKMLDVHKIHVLLSIFPASNLINSLNKILDKSMFENDKIDTFKNETYNFQKNDNSTLLFKRILNYYVKYEYRSFLIKKIMKEFVPNENEIFNSFYLTKKNIVEMNNEGMVFGSHTTSHKLLSKLDFKEQENEINKSFDYIYNEFNINNFKTFCFPYGGEISFNQNTIKILKQNNCDFAFSVENKDITSYDLNYRKYNLPRYDCNQFKYGKAR